MLLALRPAHHGDIVALQSLYSVLDAESVRLQPEHFVEAPRPKALIERHLDDLDSAVFIIHCDDEPIGFIHAQLQEPYDIGIIKPQRFVCIWDIAVREGYRGVGVGSMLLEAALDWGKEHGAHYARLNVLAHNDAAARFYAKRGFIPAQVTLEARISATADKNKRRRGKHCVYPI